MLGATVLGLASDCLKELFYILLVVVGVILFSEEDVTLGFFAKSSGMDSFSTSMTSNSSNTSLTGLLLIPATIPTSSKAASLR